MEKNNDNILYSTNPNGKIDWFYRLFCCFAKPYVLQNTYYHKVLCFSYTTDGKECCGLYVPDREHYPVYDVISYKPTENFCEFICCACCIYQNFTKHSSDVKKGEILF